MAIWDILRFPVVFVFICGLLMWLMDEDEFHGQKFKLARWFPNYFGSKSRNYLYVDGDPSKGRKYNWLQEPFVVAFKNGWHALKYVYVYCFGCAVASAAGLDYWGAWALLALPIHQGPFTFLFGSRVAEFK